MPLSMPAAVRSLARATPTIAPVPHRAVLSLSGSQASEFLHGLLASSIEDPPRPRFSAFLHAQGRVLYDVFIYTRTNPAGKHGYLLEYDARPSEAPPLLPLLKRYVLRSKVKIREATDEYDVWAAWGQDAAEPPRRWNWARSGAVEPVWNATYEWPWGTQDEMLLDRRAPGMGRRLLVQKGTRPKEAANHDATTADDYLLHRILHGVPEGSLEIPPMHAFPMDSNLDVMGGLDFRKGCYVGQELTVRTYHTGVVRKRILPVYCQKSKSGTSTNLTSNLDIKAHLTQHGDSVHPTPRPRGTGKLLNSTQDVGLALLRLEHIEGMQQGLLTFAAETEPAGSAWSITPWWPNWWPPRTSESDSQTDSS